MKNDKKMDANDILRRDGEDALRDEFDRAFGEGVEAKVLPFKSERPFAPLDEDHPASARHVAENLLLSAWLKRDIPPRDFLMGDILCTTSRWLIFGETGVGKTLLAMDMLASAGKGEGFLNWKGRGTVRRIMYLDGELPKETFKERMQLIAARYGPDIVFYGYNRDDLGDGEMPPLNTPEGEAWLMREIDLVKPDAIVFDSIMCLLAGTMAEEESWAPVKLLMRKITGRRIAQIWLHHAGHDASRGFGTKTREWEMDTVIALLKEGEEGAIRLEFRKARLRTPTTAAQYAPLIIRLTDTGWISEAATPAGAGKRPDASAILRHAFLEAYDRLADPIAKSTGFNGKDVRKVRVSAVRDALKDRGFLEMDDATLAISANGRSRFARAKTELLGKNTLMEAKGLIWRPK